METIVLSMDGELLAQAEQHQAANTGQPDQHPDVREISGAGDPVAVAILGGLIMATTVVASLNSRRGRHQRNQ